MKKRTLLPDAVENYVFESISRTTPIERRLRAETAALPRGSMQIGPDQAALMAMLVRVSGTTRALEIGTFTGYSAMAVASALPADGRLVCCDTSDEWTSIARRYWKEAGLDQKIDLRLGPALDTLNSILDDGGAESFGFAFIDADKLNYGNYYEACLKLIRPGGLIALDNMLWDGKVADPSETDEETAYLRWLNEQIGNDDRVEACLLTVGDGVMLARKRTD
jgi:predicted O-methyltransferase YrrM